MKLVSLNIWGGKIFIPLMEFIKKQAVDTDFFCFQEVWDTPTSKIVVGDIRVNMLRELRLALPGFVPYFAPTQDGLNATGLPDFPVSEGTTILIRHSHPVTEYGATFVHKTRNAGTPETRGWPSALQYVRLKTEKQVLTIYNFWGLVPEKAIIPDDPRGPDPKIDTPERIEQARRIRKILDADENSKILCGDFNLRPDTESMRIAAGNDLKNLVTEFKITDTRGPLFQQPVTYADHMLVSSQINIRNFQVPRLPLSDHLPLILSFDLNERA